MKYVITYARSEFFFLTFPAKRLNYDKARQIVINRDDLEGVIRSWTSFDIITHCYFENPFFSCVRIYILDVFAWKNTPLRIAVANDGMSSVMYIDRGVRVKVTFFKCIHLAINSRLGYG